MRPAGAPNGGRETAATRPSGAPQSIEAMMYGLDHVLIANFLGLFGEDRKANTGGRCRSPIDTLIDVSKT